MRPPNFNSEVMVNQLFSVVSNIHDGHVTKDTQLNKEEMTLPVICYTNPIAPSITQIPNT